MNRSRRVIIVVTQYIDHEFDHAPNPYKVLPYLLRA